MPRRLLKHIFAVLVVLIVAGCSGGGCGGCAGCGVTPLPSGFPTQARVENAGSVRLTQSGLGFLQDNLGTLAKSLLGDQANGGVLTFNVPSSSGSAVGIDYTICPGGPDPNANPPKCVAEVDIGNADLNLSTGAPHELLISGNLPVRLQYLPAHVQGLCIAGFCAIDTDITVSLANGGACPGTNKPFAQIPLNVDISIEIDPEQSHTARKGYSRVKVANLNIDQGKIEDSLGFCGGFLGGLLDAAKGLFAGQLIDPLIGTLTDQIDQQLCQKSNPMLDPVCPDGSTDDGGTCMYADGTCVSIMLGTDGHMDLGSLLASLSPGTKGGLDFLFAAGGENGDPVNGNLNPTPNAPGATLGLFGGALPKPQSSCVKLANMDPPVGIEIPDEIKANTVSGWPGGMAGPHVGIALNERFFNYALAGMYDSGLLCIGIGGESLNLGPISFNSDLFGTFLGAGSVKDLGLQNEAQNLALVVRPSAPPTAVFGNGTNIDTDPLIRIGVKQLSIDFYIWSLDRYVRFLTYTVDIDVPLNLTVTPDGLVPVVKTINLTNPTGTNASLLSEDPNEIAKKLTDLIGSQLGSVLGGAIPAVNLNDQLAGLGLTLNIPETVEGQGSAGLRKLSKGSDNYLGIFATFGLAAAPPPPQSHTSAKLLSKKIDVAGLAARTATSDNAPSARIAFSSQLDDGSHPVEYQIRVDGGFWQPWTRRRELDVQSGAFRLQGKHRIEVRSRIVGEVMSLDPEPAVIEVSIDAKPPVVRVDESEEGKATIVVKDSVSAIESVLVRYRLDGGAWSEWLHADALPVLDVTKSWTLDVEAKDEEGLVASAAQAIRGKPAATSGGGCGCTVAGDDAMGQKGLWILGALLAGIVLRLGKRRGQEATNEDDATIAAATPSVAPRSAKKPSRTLGALGALSAIAIAGVAAGCNCGGSESTSGSTTTTTDTGCATCDTLLPGLAGEYSSVTVASGSIWVAGYMEKAISENGSAYQYGDLAVGKYDGTKVDWQFVDGVPEQEVDPKEFDPAGFRGGVTDPGDDVGLWTSIAANDAGVLGVAYYDRTNRALKFALQDGAGWKVTAVQQKPTSDIGRYAKLAFLNGQWTIAFLSIEPGEAGAVTSGVRLATSSDGSAWSFEDVVQNKATPCSAKLCASGSACLKDTGICQAELAKASCDPSCSSSQACVDVGAGPACADKHTTAETETYPTATGAYVAIAKEKGGTLGIVYYDRVAGDLVAASKASGQWVTTVLDGQSVGAGDVGIGATLAIDDSGVWHVAYSNGYDESLQYIQVNNGMPGVPEVIDDGSGIEGTQFDDGRHIVGDDASIRVSASGDIQVSYQDATAGTLRWATGTASANGHSWAVKAVPQDGFAGAFSKVFDNGGQVQVMNWWRKGGETYVGDVAIVTP